jgi:hypothetical protein
MDLRSILRPILADLDPPRVKALQAEGLLQAEVRERLQFHEDNVLGFHLPHGWEEHSERIALEMLTGCKGIQWERRGHGDLTLHTQPDPRLIRAFAPVVAPYLEGKLQGRRRTVPPLKRLDQTLRLTSRQGEGDCAFIDGQLMLINWKQHFCALPPSLHQSSSSVWDDILGERPF